MTKLGSHTLIFLSLTLILLGSTRGVASPDVCRQLLTEYLQKSRASDKPGWSPEMQKYLEEAHQAQSTHPIPFSKVEELLPLFNYGMVHWAVAEELKSRGLHTTAELQGALDAVRYYEDDKQIDFVDAVVMRLVYSLKDISIEGDKFREMQADAKHYNLNLDEYMSFINAWITQRTSNYVTIKLAILDNLHNVTEPMKIPVGEYGSAKQRALDKIKRLTRNQKALALPPDAVPTTIAALVLSEGKEAYPALTDFYAKVPSFGVSLFLETHYRNLSRVQLSDLVADRARFSTLESTTQLDIRHRLNWFNELYKKHEELHARLTAIDARLSALEEELTSYVPVADLVGVSISPEEFGILLDSVARIKTFTYASEAVKVVKTAFKDYRGRLNKEQFKALAQGAIHESYKFIDVNKFSDYAIIEMAQSLQSESRFTILPQNEVVAILAKLQERSAGFDTSNTAAMNKIIRLPWGKLQTAKTDTVERASVMIPQLEREHEQLLVEQANLKQEAARADLELAQKTEADAPSPR